MRKQDPAREASHCLNVTDQIDFICDLFEKEWLASGQPRIEDFLLRAEAGAARTRLLHELLRMELEYRRKNGELPTREHYATRFADYAAILDELFSTAEEVASNGGVASRMRAGKMEMEEGHAAVPAIPGYEVLEQLGRGGMGIVYRARDFRLKRIVALKVIRDNLVNSTVLARFQIEAEAFAQLSHHHIVRVYDAGQWRPTGGDVDQPYLALEYIDGQNLEQHLKLLGSQCTNPVKAAKLLRLLTRAIHAIHQKNIVHRDLKPANVLMAPPADEPAMNSAWGCPKISDFGLARQVEGDQRLTEEGARLGTPDYMAPEQAKGSPEVGPPADIWALGVILYRLLAGRLPFEASTTFDVLNKICNETPPPLRNLSPELPDELERICKLCLEKDPVRRPTAARLAELLDRFLSAGELAEEQRQHLNQLASELKEAMLSSINRADIRRLEPTPPPFDSRLQDIKERLFILAVVRVLSSVGCFIACFWAALDGREEVAFYYVLLGSANSVFFVIDTTEWILLLLLRWRLLLLTLTVVLSLAIQAFLFIILIFAGMERGKLDLLDLTIWWTWFVVGWGVIVAWRAARFLRELDARILFQDRKR